MFVLIKYFFMVLGVVFFLLLIALWYIWHTDLWSVRTVADYVLERSAPGAGIEEMLVDTVGTSEVATIEWTETELDCFRSLFGAERVTAIEAGAEPSAAELLQGLACVEPREE